MINVFQMFTRTFGIEVVKYNIYHSDDVLLNHIINHFQVKTIIDVGANIGQYGESVIRHGFRGEIYSFEPINSVFKRLEKKSKTHANWHVYNFGVGSSNGESIINISENFVSSSILKVAEASLSAEPKTKIVNSETIRIISLDSFCSDKNLMKQVLLKLDVQGYEMEALKGALDYLPQIKLIQVELSFVEIYQGGPLFNEIVKFLGENGFEIFTILPGFRDEKSGRMLQADGVFVKKN